MPLYQGEKFLKNQIGSYYLWNNKKASLPTSHCDPLKPAGHSHFSELALQVLLCMYNIKQSIVT